MLIHTGNIDALTSDLAFLLGIALPENQTLVIA
jgi:hypothetical protein